MLFARHRAGAAVLVPRPTLKSSEYFAMFSNAPPTVWYGPHSTNGPDASRGTPQLVRGRVGEVAPVRPEERGDGRRRARRGVSAVAVAGPARMLRVRPTPEPCPHEVASPGRRRSLFGVRVGEREPCRPERSRGVTSACGMRVARGRSERDAHVRPRVVCRGSSATVEEVVGADQVQRVARAHVRAAFWIANGSARDDVGRRHECARAGRRPPATHRL